MLLQLCPFHAFPLLLDSHLLSITCMQSGGNNVETRYSKNAPKCGTSKILMGSCDQDEQQYRSKKECPFIVGAFFGMTADHVPHLFWA